ncbi:MAG: glycosyl transferase [Clostridia bacterium]|nr:glycosyl transferase [Clostridia bacterium]
MIPKIIHYVWVGGKDKPEDVKKCIATWKKHCEGYEIKEWNESNFDINSHPFVKAAYEQKKWAFVSDYIRAYAVYTEGGIYMDTDVLVLKSLDGLLNNKAFVGFEDKDLPFSAVFGAEKNHPFVKKIMDSYEDKEISFLPKDANTFQVKKILVEEYQCKLGNVEQDLKDGIHVYKNQLLCKPSLQSITIHVFTGSWLDKKRKCISKMDHKFRMKLTNHCMVLLYLPFKLLITIIKWLFSFGKTK